MKHAAILLAVLTVGCAHKPARTSMQIVIPQGCITSDVVCTPGKKKMDCKFDKFKSCEVIKVKDASK